LVFQILNPKVATLRNNMQKFDDLKALVNSLESEVAKIEAGNKAARTRVRVALQKAKVLAQDLRLEINSMA
jgi:uncharacterized protein YdcH (DUF465 family)